MALCEVDVAPVLVVVGAVVDVVDGVVVVVGGAVAVAVVVGVLDGAEPDDGATARLPPAVVGGLDVVEAEGGGGAVVVLDADVVVDEDEATPVAAPGRVIGTGVEWNRSTPKTPAAVPPRTKG